MLSFIYGRWLEPGTLPAQVFAGVNGAAHNA
jgi:hypothetical protein